jgi:hypothetical protein
MPGRNARYFITVTAPGGVTIDVGDSGSAHS